MNITLTNLEDCWVWIFIVTTEATTINIFLGQFKIDLNRKWILFFISKISGIKNIDDRLHKFCRSGYIAKIMDIDSYGYFAII